MIKEDLIAERIAIETYRDLVRHGSVTSLTRKRVDASDIDATRGLIPGNARLDE